MCGLFFLPVPINDALKLSKILSTPSVELVHYDNNGVYIIRCKHRQWIIWIHNPQWQELDDSGELLGELHYGSLSTFYKKCIEENSDLPVNFGKKWNKVDIESLFRHMAEEKTVTDIAVLLGRSPYGVLLRVGLLLGLDFDQGRYDDSDFDTALAELVRRQVALQVACLDDDD